MLHLQHYSSLLNHQQLSTSPLSALLFSPSFLRHVLSILLFSRTPASLLCSAFSLLQCISTRHINISSPLPKNMLPPLCHFFLLCHPWIFHPFHESPSFVGLLLKKLSSVVSSRLVFMWNSSSAHLIILKWNNTSSPLLGVDALGVTETQGDGLKLCSSKI